MESIYIIIGRVESAKHFTTFLWVAQMGQNILFLLKYRELVKIVESTSGERTRKQHGSFVLDIVKKNSTMNIYIYIFISLESFNYKGGGIEGDTLQTF